MSNKKNPVAGNVNQAPMKDAGTGQVLDNTDNKGGHLDQVENIAGSDTIKRVGPISDPVEANSNVQKDPRDQVTVDTKAGESSDAKSSGSQNESGKGDAALTKESQSSDSTSAKPSEEKSGNSAESSSESKDQKSSSATEGADAQDTIVSAKDTQGNADPVPAPSRNNAVQSSDQGKTQESQNGDKASVGSSDADKAQEDQTVELTPKESEKLSEADLRTLYTNKLPEDTLRSWDYNTLLMYHLKRAMPSKTNRGNWPVDVRRERGMANWNSDELLDWLSGDIVKPKNVLEEDLWDEIFKRFRLPGNWSYDQAKKFIQTGERPEYTKNGVLIEDSSRAGKEIGNWTYLELRTALLGEIETPFTQEELLEQLRKRLGLSENYSGSRLLESLPETPTEANVNDTLLTSKLDEYKTVMTKSGKNLSPETAGQAQAMLYKAIRSVMNREPQEFHEGYNILLDFVNQNYNELFTPEKARRGWAHLGSMSKSAISTFEDVLTLMIQTRKPGNRAAAAKIYSLDQILRHVTSEQERNNIIHYYAAT